MKCLERLVVLLCALAWSPVHALNYQLHGFASHGALYSDENNFFGDSTDVSFDYYEAGLNGTLELNDELLVSAQGILRDAGSSDDGRPELDYAFADWRMISTQQAAVGLRAGRVKNAIGLYNDTRDVIFTRPTIILPQSVYFEGSNARSFLFSSDGAQLYATIDHGLHQFSLNFSRAIDRPLREEEERSLALPPAINDVELRDAQFFRVMESFNGGRVIVALSQTEGRLSSSSGTASPADAELTISVASLQINGPKFSITSEYQTTRAEGTVFGSRLNSTGDGGYLQLEYRFIPGWTAVMRYDTRFSDKRDRGGSRAAALTGQPRHRFFSHDLTAGLNWRSDRHWGAWLEVHRIYGTAFADPLDNPGGANESHWTLVTMMLGFRF